MSERGERKRDRERERYSESEREKEREKERGEIMIKIGYRRETGRGKRTKHRESSVA